jgi:hypothetical protein
MRTSSQFKKMNRYVLLISESGGLLEPVAIERRGKRRRKGSPLHHATTQVQGQGVQERTGTTPAPEVSGLQLYLRDTSETRYRVQGSASLLAKLWELTRRTWGVSVDRFRKGVWPL